MIIETHAHICDSAYDSDRSEMLERAESAGVKKFINIGADPAEAAKVAAFDRPGVYKAAGLHPHYAEDYSDEYFEEFKGFYREGKNMAAVGEIGLDYFKSPTPKEKQEKYFRKFLSAADELNMPVIIHSRGAHEDTYAILKECGPERRGVIHCFTGSYEEAKKFYDSGYLLGIGGVLTFPNAGPLAETVEKMPLRSMVLETDAPWLAPQDVRGKRNEPACLAFIAEKLAAIKGVGAKEVEEKTSGNASRLFAV